MISIEEYASYDGLGLAELVERGDVTASELRDAAIAAIEAKNPALNAVLQILKEESSEEIRQGLPQGPFRGVPFGIKEFVLHAAGVRFDLGSRIAEGTVLPHDTALMSRFRQAGLVTVATTQTPEFGFCTTTESVLHGPVHNPWKPGFTPGGSSGGSAAAVAAGILPLAHANDGGGSIRVPASCCGLVGLKPSRDRIPSGPDVSDPLFGAATEFALTKSVRDTAALLDCVAGPDIGASGHPVPPARPFVEEVRANVEPLRFAWTTTLPSGQQIDPECRLAVENTVKLLESLGHKGTEASPEYSWDEFLQSTATMWATAMAAMIDGFGGLNGRTPSPDNLEAATWAAYQDGKKTSAEALMGALAHINVLSRSFGTFFEQFDVWVTPTISSRPLAHGELDQNRAGISTAEWAEQVFGWCCFSPQLNNTGLPGISLPLHMSADGLPVGVQIAGPLGSESTLIRLASQLEQARPWQTTVD